MSDYDDGEASLGLDAIFPEPPRPKTPPPSFTTYTREAAPDGAWKSIEIRLVGDHPLWGHYLWNAARAFSTYLDSNQELYKGRNVLELGAGGGLPGLVTALDGAQKVVLTDYPDATLVDNLDFNTQQNLPASIAANVAVQGYIWGTPVAPLLEKLPAGRQGFDLVILSDLIFNHSQHDALLKTCEQCTAEPSSAAPPYVLVFYTHHRPHLAHRDMEFFAKARERGWSCQEVLTERFPPMFPDDPGAEEVRSTVHGWRLTRATE
ncbi:putative methyltransferase-domain-containing protein [Schizophyllum amplum]|uniref:Protein N-terminal and lysine N-methyltransferase EFM7 n=1 Tax=Schizophyllum amplum TaxID=97359 RepID=A0A550CQR3_9AGAR|nr:putative methyltransferase-domain-containing protein [Auriculariopsis ampla]